MPPYGIDSLLNRNFDAEGFFESPEESLYDPAFGTLNYETAYGPAPYTGNIPLTSYRVQPGSEYLSGDGTFRNLGFMGDIDLPSFGGSGNPKFNQFGKDIDFINPPQNTYPAAVPSDFINTPQNFYPPNLTSTKGLPTLDLQSLPANMGVANEDDVDQVDYLGSKPNKSQKGIAKLLEFFQRLSPVANIARGIDSLRNRIDTRKAIQRDTQRDTQGTINNIVSPRITNIKPTAQDTARGSIPSRTTSAPKRSFSSDYSAAQRARKF